jgi:hypothetical protein
MNLDETDLSQAKLTDLQRKAIEIVRAFEEIDTAMLSACTPQERALQAEVRHRLYEFVDHIWSEPEKVSRGEAHASHHPAYAGAGALRDLLMSLWVNAQEAQDGAGDPVESTRVQTTVTVETD